MGRDVEDRILRHRGLNRVGGRLSAGYESCAGHGGPNMVGFELRAG